MVTPVQQAAVDDIRGRLDNSGLFDAISHDDMNAIADRLQGLNATDADAVIDELKKQGLLDKLASESVDGAWFGNGGFSDSERKAFFDNLASKLDGDSLAAVTRALHKTDDGSDGFHRVQELADSIARNSPSWEKVNYVEALKNELAGDRPWIEGHIVSATSHSQDFEGAAVAKVLTSLEGSPYVTDGFKALNHDQLRAVMNATIDEKMTTSMGSPSVSWNAEGFRNLMSAAASSYDAELKAQVFDAGADTLRQVRETNGFAGQPVIAGRDDTMKLIAEGLTKIIDSDTNGVIRELTFDKDTDEGSDMATYTRAMMESGQEGKLGEIMAKLQLGNDLKGNAVDRLDEVTQVPGGRQERRENADKLGYFVGALYAGANSWSTDVKAQQEVVTSILDSTLAVIDKSKIGGDVVGGAASVAKEWTHYAVRAMIEDPGVAPAQRLEKAALPIDPATDERAVGDNVQQSFSTSVTDVIRNAQP